MWNDPDIVKIVVRFSSRDLFSRSQSIISSTAEVRNILRHNTYDCIIFELLFYLIFTALNIVPLQTFCIFELILLSHA